MRLHAVRHTLGGYMSHAKAVLGHVDTGIRVMHAVHSVVKDKLPDKMAQKASKGFSDYEKAREAIRLQIGKKDD